MSGDPTNVCRAPVDIIGLVVKHQFEGGGSVEHVAADGVKNSLQTRGGLTEVEKEKKKKTVSSVSKGVIYRAEDKELILKFKRTGVKKTDILTLQVEVKIHGLWCK